MSHPPPSFQMPLPNATEQPTDKPANFRNGPRNMLTHQQTYALCRWIEYNKAALQEAKLSLNQLAEKATVDLKFTVTGNNVVGAEDTTGIKVHYTERTRSATASRVDRNHVLALAVLRLFQRLGEPVPDELMAIVKRESSHTDGAHA